MANVSSSNGIEKYPKLRFPEFTEPWKKIKIGDIYAERSERGSETSELLSVTMNDGVKRRSELEGKDNSSEDKGNYKVVCTGDMVYNSMRMWQGANGISPYNGIVSPAYTVLTAKCDISNGFFAALFKTHKLISEFCKHSQGMTSDTWNLKYPQIESIKTYIPSVAEQKKIAALIEKVDKRIAIQKELIDSLKKYKRGAFESVFSQKLKLTNSNTPWKKFKLSDFATRITRKNGEQTDIPLTISAQYGLIDQRNFFSKTVASTDMSGYYLLKSGEFAYNRSTSNDYPFGSIKRLEKYKKGAVSTLYICFEINKEIMNSDFITLFFESTKWHKQISEICAEGARNHGLLNVPTNGFFDCVFDLPSNLDEQEKIASLLNAIQDKLDNENKILEQLQFFKKALLQSMFI